MALFAYSFPFEGVGDVHHAEVERQDLAGVDDVALEQKEDVMNEMRHLPGECLIGVLSVAVTHWLMRK